MNHLENPYLPRTAGIEDRDLRIEVFAICEGSAEQNGKLSLLGAFEMISVPRLPFLFPQLTVALRLRFWPAEGLAHSVRMEITNPDGRTVVRSGEGRLTLNPLSPDRSIAYNLVTHFQNVQFDETGDYTIDFYLNKRLEGRLPFLVTPHDVPISALG